MDVAVRLLRRAEHPQQQQAASVQPVDERAVDPERGHHGRQRVERRRSRVLQCQRLRHQLAEDHLRGGEHQQHDDRRRGLRRQRLEAAEAGQLRREPDGERGLRVGAEAQARDGDADLARGDVAIERGRCPQPRQQPARERVAVRRHLPQAALADADGRELRRHVDGVDQDEGRRDEDGHEDHEGQRCTNSGRVGRCRETGRELEGQRRDLRRALQVDLLPVVAGAVVVAVEAGEEVDGRDAPRLERGIVAASRARPVTLDAEAAQPLSRAFEVGFDRRRVLETAHVHAAAGPPHHVEVEHGDGVGHRHRRAFHVVRRPQQPALLSRERDEHDGAREALALGGSLPARFR